MRERLIELLFTFYDEIETITEEDIENIADYLLENGVVVLPCKVGDTVYIVDRISDSVVSGMITHFEYNLYTTPREWITVVSNELWYGKTKIRNRIDLLIGKTVFLTREDAEKALRKEDEGK